MGIRTKLKDMPGGWVFLLGVVGFFVWFYASDRLRDLLASFADWLVSIGGYGLSNAVFAALVGAGCFAGLEITRRRLHRVDVMNQLADESLVPPVPFELIAQVPGPAGTLGAAEPAPPRSVR